MEYRQFSPKKFIHIGKNRMKKGGRVMFWTQLLNFLSGIVYLLLHVTGGGAFPKALSAAEEKKCLEEMAQGSRAARQKLIEHNLRLVAHIIKNGYSRGKFFRSSVG